MSNKLQIRLWEECNNNCDFCYIQDKHYISLKDKKERLNTLKNIEKDTLSIIGGDFFQGQVYGCEEEWLNFIKFNKSKKIYISATLNNTPYLLQETLNIRPDILICTSYDTVGRFKSYTEKYNWLKRVESIDNIFCTSIITQDLINDNFYESIKCNKTILEPHPKFTNNNYYFEKDKYRNILLSNTPFFNLPKRSDFLKWIQRYKNIIYNLKNYKDTHFNDIYTFNKNNSLVPEIINRFYTEEYCSKCGHPIYSKCYIDSDKCLLCDIERLY